MKHTYFELKTLEKDLGVSAKVLYTLSNQINWHYHSVEIPKSDGGTRRLSVPDPLLKSVQRKINEVILSGMAVSIYSKAYSFGDSPLGNALPHLGKEEILKLDIRKFFDHVTYPLIKKRSLQQIVFLNPTGFCYLFCVSMMNPFRRELPLHRRSPISYFMTLMWNWETGVITKESLIRDIAMI